MENLIWIGTAVSLLGLAGLIWCIVRVARIRNKDLPDTELRIRLKEVLPLNLGALLLSVLGLMLVVIGILLG